MVDDEKIDFCDPLRGPSADAVDAEDLRNDASATALSGADAIRVQAKEWTSFKKLLMQRFSSSKMVSIATVSMPVLLYSYMFRDHVAVLRVFYF